MAFRRQGALLLAFLLTAGPIPASSPAPQPIFSRPPAGPMPAAGRLPAPPDSRSREAEAAPATATALPEVRPAPRATLSPGAEHVLTAGSGGKARSSSESETGTASAGPSLLRSAGPPPAPGIQKAAAAVRSLSARATVRPPEAPASLIKHSPNEYLAPEAPFPPPGLRREETETRRRFRHPEGDVVDSVYDADGRLVRVESPEGVIASFRYDAAGRRTAMTDRRGTTVYRYDSQGRLHEIEVPGRGSIRYDHGADGRLARLTDPAGRAVDLAWDSAGRLVSAAGTRYEYDPASGRLVRRLLPNGLEADLGYDADGRLTETRYRDAAGRTVLAFRFQLDERGLPVALTRETAEGSETTTYTWDAARRLSLVHTADGRSLSQVHDEAGRRIQATVTAGGRVDIVDFSYDESGRLSAAGDETFDYDARGNVIRRSSPERTVAMAWDLENRLVQWSDGRRTVELEYDGDGRRIARVADGRRTEYILDAGGAVLLESGNGVRRSYLYGLERIGFQEGEGRQGFYLYDAPFWNVAAVAGPAGGLLQSFAAEPFGMALPGGPPPAPFLYGGWSRDPVTGLVLLDGREYDPGLGIFLSQAPPSRGTAPSPAGAETAAPALPDLLALTLGAAPESAAANPGRSTGETAKRGPPVRVTTFQSNQLPEPSAQGAPPAALRPFPRLSQLQGDGGPLRRALQADTVAGPRLRTHPDYLVFVSTAAGLLPASQTLEVASSTGEAVGFTAAESLSWLQISAGGGTTPAGLTVTVDAAGLASAGSPYTGDIVLTSTADPADVRTVRVRLSVTDGYAAPALQSYDGNGNLQRAIRADGGIVDYRSDDAGRISRVRYPDGQEVAYTYDRNGNRLTMTDSRGTTVYQYDLDGRITAVFPPGLNPVRYAYDRAGNLAGLLYPDGREVLYTYDSHQRIVSVQDAAGTTTYTYDPATGNLASKTLPNGITTTFGYGATGLLSDVTHTGPGGLLQRFHYERDGNSLRTSVSRETPSGTETTTYAYDALLRLSSVAYPSGHRVDYTYDEIGNRLSMTETAGGNAWTTTYAYGPDNRLLRAGNEVFQYDASGALIRRASPSRTVEYTWDGAGRLTGWSDGNRTVQLEYDGDGNRVAKIVDGVRTNYYLDVNRYPVEPLLEADGGWYVRQSHVYGTDRISTAPAGAGPVFYLYDSPLRSVTALAAADGSLARTYGYDAFGAPAASAPGFLQSFLFNGETYDEETGLVYLRNRYYDPALGRFISPDLHPGKPRQPESQNPYVFAYNNPVNFVDQDGRLWDIVADVVFLGYDIVQLVKDPTDPVNWAAFGADALGAALPFATGLGAGVRATRAGAHYATTSNRLGNVGEVFVGARQGILESRHAEKIVTGEIVRAPDFLLGNNLIEVKNAARIDSRSTGQILDYLSWTGSRGGTLELATRSGTEIPSVFSPYIDSGALKVSRAFTDAGSPMWWSYGRTWSGAGIGATSNFLYQNLGGGLGDLGGVSLNKTAELMLAIDDVAGATFDPATGQLVLYGREDVALPEMDLDDLAVAVRSVFAGQDPGVSIDPPIVNNQMSVRFEGETASTEFGGIMFEADRVLKILTLGKDNITGQPVSSSVPGYRNMLQRRLDAGCGSVPQTTRMWFQPREVRLVRSQDGQSMVFDTVSMELLYESKTGDQVVSDPQAAAFATHFTQNYDAFAAEWPVLRDLKRLGKVVAVMKWIKDNQIPIDLSFIDNYPIEYFSTPVTTPATTVQGTRNSCIVTIQGGVTYRKPNQYLADDPVDPITDELRDAALSSRPEETDFLWTFQTTAGGAALEAGETLTAIAQSFTRSRKDGNESFAETDLAYPVAGAFSLELVRYYDSFTDRPGPFGPGWSVLPHQLRFPVEKERFTFGPDNLAFDLHARIWVAERAAGREDEYVLLGIDANDLPLYQRSGAIHLLRQLANGSFQLTRADGLRIGFDPQGLPTSVEDPSGNRLEHIYDAASRLVRVQGPGGRALDLAYDAQSRVIRVTGPGGRQVEYAYDASGRLRSVTYPGSRTRTFSYDAEGRLSGATDATGNPVLASGYDDYGRAVDRQVGTAAGFDLSFDLESRRTVATGPQGDRVDTRFDERFRPIRQVDALDHEVQVEYDGDFGPSRLTDAKGASRLLGYDLRGNLTTAVDATGARVEMFYDWRDRLVATRDGEGGEVAFGYDEKDNLTTVYHFVQLEQDEDGNLTGFLYDPSRITRFAYRTDGLPESVTNPLGQQIGYAFDSHGQLVGTSSGALSSTFGYDARSRLSQIVAGGRQTNLVYDGADHLTAIDTPGTDVSFAYDPDGRMTRLSDGQGRDTEFTYDANGNLSTVRDAAGDLTSYTYDVLGHLTSSALPNGSANAFEHDELGRPVVVLTGLGPAQPDLEIVQTALDFGEVGVGGNVEIALRVFNVGRAALQVSSASTSAPFSATGSGVVPPGRTLDITVGFSPVDSGAATGTLTLTSNDPGEPVRTVSLMGQGVRKIVGLRATPTPTGIRLDWNPFDPGAQPFAHFNIYRSSSPIPGSVAGMTPIDSSLTNPAALSFLDTTPAPGQPYFYAVTAEYAGGFEYDKVDPAGPAVFFSDATAFGNLGPAAVAAEAPQGEHRPAVAFNPAADEYLLVYEVEAAAGGGNPDLWARRIAADGTVLGSAVPLATSTARERNPQVAFGTVPGEYLVVWEHDASAGGTNSDIRGQRVSAAGALLGSALAIAANPVDDRRPHLAYNADDNQYLVVFDHDFSGDGSDRDIRGRRVSGSGSLVGSELVLGDILVNGSPVDDRGPNVAYDPSSREYLLAYELDTLGDGSDLDILGQRVAASGTLTGNPFFLARFLIDGRDVHETRPRLAWDSVHDEYMLAFEVDYYRDGTDLDAFVRKLRFDAGGAPVGVGPLAVAVAAADGRKEAAPRVAYSAATDENLVVWEVDGDIQARRVKITGSSLVLASTVTVAAETAREARPDLAHNGELNQFLAAWESDVAGNSDLRVRRLGYATPRIEVAPQALAFGTGSSSLSATVSNLGPGTLSWVATPDRPWITVAPASASTPVSTSLTVSVTRAGLAPGSHTGTVRFSSNGGTADLAVSLTVENRPPAEPGSPAPAHGAADQTGPGGSLDLPLSWQGSDPDGDALTWDVYFSTDAARVSALDPGVRLRQGLTATSTQAAGLSFLTTYTWRVVASDGQGGVTAGPPWTFTTAAVPAPVLTPYAPDPTRETRPTFSWQPVTGAAGYHLQAAADAGFTSLRIDQSGLTATSFQPGAALPQGTLHWRVRSLDGGGRPGPFSAPDSFEIDTTPPAVPALVPVTPDPTNDPRPLFAWNAISGAAGYRVQVAASPSFAPVLLDLVVTATSFEPSTDLPQGTLSWRAASQDAAGNQSAFSSPDSFALDRTPPAAITGLTATRSGSAVILSWNPAGPIADFGHFNVYRAESPFDNVTGRIPIDSFLVDGTAVSFTDQAAPPGAPYHYAVTLVDTAGNENRSVVTAFVPANAPPTTPGTPTPDDGSQGPSSPAVVLTWQASDPEGQPLIYDVYLSDARTPVELFDLSARVAASLTEARLEVPGLVAGTTYYWRVVAFDPAGGSAAGPVWSLTAEDRRGEFYTLDPCRVFDTRKPEGPYGGPVLAGGTDRAFPVAGVCGIPATAKAVAVNVSVVGPTGPGYLTAYPGGIPAPLVSTINFGVNTNRTNNAVLALASDGSGVLMIRAGLAGGGTVHVVLDVYGYFE